MKKTLLMAALAATVVCTGCGNTRKTGNTPEEENAKRRDNVHVNSVYVEDGYRRLDPYTVLVKEPVKWIFPVPEPDAVGTIDLDNAITFLKFCDGETTPEYRIVAQNFSKTVSGNFDYRFSPNFAGDMVVYSKTRVAVICDLKTGEAFHAGFGLTMDDYMLGIRFLDPQNKLFIVVKSIEAGGGLDDPWVDNLHLAKLDGKQLVDLGEIMPRIKENQSISQDFPAYNRWVIHNRKLIAYDGERSKRMLCFDGLNETAHPFAEAFNRNAGKFRSLRDFAVHPELPFGVIVEDTDISEAPESMDTHYILLVRWDTDDPDGQLTAIHQKLMLLLCPLFNIKTEYFACAYPSFSPDGKWFVIGIFSYNTFTSPYFVAIPVSEKYPNFLNIDKLVVLGKVERMTSAAWTADPSAFVAANRGMSLKKWGLGNLREDP